MPNIPSWNERSNKFANERSNKYANERSNKYKKDS
jgi:hypothetical protein